MARGAAADSDDARFFGSAGPATLALSAFGTSALVPLFLIAIIAGSTAGMVGCLVAMAIVVWATLRALRVGYRLEGAILTSNRASKRAPSQEIDLARVERTGRQRRDHVILKMAGNDEDDAGEPVRLDLRLLSMDASIRLRSVFESEFGIDCSTWGVTGSERARRDRAQPLA